MTLSYCLNCSSNALSLSTSVHERISDRCEDIAQPAAGDAVNPGVLVVGSAFNTATANRVLLTHDLPSIPGRQELTLVCTNLIAVSIISGNGVTI
jgi:hypothetical protein